MADQTTLATLLLHIAAHRERAEAARRLAHDLTDAQAIKGLRELAAELEQKAAEMETQATVLKEAMKESEAAPDQDIAALKPPPEPPA